MQGCEPGCSETVVSVGSIPGKSERPREAATVSLESVAGIKTSSPESAIGRGWQCPIISFEASLATCQKAWRLKSSKLVGNASCGDPWDCPAGQSEATVFDSSAQGKLVQPSALGVLSCDQPI